MDQSKDFHLHKGPIRSSAIPVTVAKERVRNWLKLLSTIGNFKDHPTTMPRAIYISMDDIAQLLNEYKKYEINGIRVYFGLKEDPSQRTHPSKSQDLSGLIVPVFKADEFRQHKDHIVSDLDDPNDTSVYDFTAPCPAYCDKQSELYVPFP